MKPEQEPDRRAPEGDSPKEHVVLTVKDATQADVGLAVARLDRSTRDTLGVDVHQVVELRSKGKVSGATVKALPEKEEGQGVIRIDDLVRRSLGVSIGHPIEARKANTELAQAITIAPIISDGHKFTYGQGIEGFVRRVLLKRPLTKGDIVIVPGIALMGGALPFMVIQVTPDGIVQSNEDTVITVEAEPVRDGKVGPVLSREEMQKQLVEAKTVLQYAQAEVENVRKASERDRAEYARQAAWSVLEKVLPPLDDLEAAVAGLPPEHAAGVSMVRNNFLNALHEIGLVEIKADGLQFDPYKHEAVEVITDSNLEDGTVARVLRKGYSYNRKVLRPALVAVVKRGEEDG